jgi:hypothetical protein
MRGRNDELEERYSRRNKVERKKKSIVSFVSVSPARVGSYSLVFIFANGILLREPARYGMLITPIPGS